MREKTDKVITDPSFLDIDQSTLVTILEQTFLMVSSELDLIDASLRWANQEAEHRDLDMCDGTVLREILGRAFSLLRFLTLMPSEFASGPALSSLLTHEESFAILVNLNSPGSMAIPAGICNSTEMRCCPRNDGFIWDAERHSTNLCQRLTFIDNKGIIESAVTFTVNKNIRILGIQVSSQVINSGRITETDVGKSYSELVIVSLAGSSKNLLAYVHFEADVKFNSVVDIKFEHSVEVKQQEEHTLRVWFHRPGCYPKSTLDSNVKIGDVVFKFDKAETDVVRAISFTPSSAADSKTFKFVSPITLDQTSKPRKFSFTPRQGKTLSSSNTTFVAAPSSVHAAIGSSNQWSVELDISLLQNTTKIDFFKRFN